MPAGLQLWNAYGDLLCDSSNINMFLRHSGTSPGGAYPSISVAAVDPVIFIRPLTNPSYVVSAVLSGGTLSVTFRNPCEYYIFDRPVLTSYLDVFDESGRHVFTAAQRPLNIIGSVNIPAYYTSYRSAYRDGWTYSGLTSGKYAYNQAFVRQGYDSLPTVGRWDTWLIPESLAPTANGFHASFADSGTPLLGWSPTYQNEFISYAPSPPVSIIDVAGIL